MKHHMSYSGKTNDATQPSGVSLSHGAPVCYLISNEVAQKMIPRVFLSTCPNLLTLVKIAEVPGATLQSLSISNVIKTGSSRRQLHLVRPQSKLA